MSFISSIKKFEGCLYEFDAMHCLNLYIPYPSLEELGDYRISRFYQFPGQLDFINKGDATINQEKLNLLKQYFQKKFLGKPKRRKYDYINSFNGISYRQDDITNIIEYSLWGSFKDFKDSHLIDLYIEKNYPITYREIKNGSLDIIDINFLDDSVWTININQINGFEYFYVRFELGDAARLIKKFSNIQFYNSGSFWYEAFFEPFFELEEYFNNEIPFFSLRE